MTFTHTVIVEVQGGVRREMTYTHTVVVEVQTGVEGDDIYSHCGRGSTDGGRGR